MDKLQAIWDKVQDLLDVRGDVVMLAISSAFILRIVAALSPKFAPINASEAAFYASAIGAFAWSNKGPKV